MLLGIVAGGWCFSAGRSGHLALGPASIDLNGLFDAPWASLVILCLPLVAAFVQIFFGRKLPRNGDWVSTIAVGAGLALSLMMLGRIIGIYDWQFERVHEMEWISLFSRTFPGAQDVVTFRVPMGILIDNVTVIMLVVVTLVSTLVHIYSIGYMADDPRYSRFFAYLSIFTFSMLGLVLCNNVFALYMFWELVGLSSYLLIGFWFEKKSAADAQKKAFLVNRVGDIGMFLGILTFFLMTGELTYKGIFGSVANGAFGAQMGLLTAAGVLLFMGAVGKSAQFPLHIWLPDAMEGPTPVSALIHAATMVAAGVYLVTRMYPVFTPNALIVIAWFGGFTAIFAATIALCANDIKKVLAYSTVSQLGYMIMGLGAGAYTNGFFHLWTHAFFKACLFLGSGSVIHAVVTQDMREMGGLRRKMPITFWTMLLSTLAIAGVPFTSGFTSKDGILGDLLFAAHEHPALWPVVIFAFAGAGLTAFYMFRLIFMTFTGEPRAKEKFEHAHESPWVMAAPLVILGSLAILSDKGGWFQELVGKPESAAAAAIAHAEAMKPGAKPHAEKAPGHEGDAGPSHAKAPDVGSGYVGSLPVAHAGANPYHPPHSEELHHAHSAAMVLSILVAGLGIGLSFFTYQKKLIDPAKIAAAAAPVHRLLLNKYWIDEFFHETLVKPALSISRACSRFDLKVVDGFVNLWGKATEVWSWIAGTFDQKVVDGAVNGTADVVMSAGAALSRFQTGRLKTYLAWAVAGLVILTGGFHLVTHWAQIVEHLTRK
ncbi:MAG: NADH-quinone oxidoreductase subunit L [Planctomycetes bacterium]|nr:NADH-quinone oxidoreductase subunit L [Planctomycetota bacterium]